MRHSSPFILFENKDDHRNIAVRIADKLSRENMKRFFSAEKVYQGNHTHLFDIEEMLLDSVGDVELTTNINPFEDNSEDRIEESLRPVEAVEAWNEFSSVKIDFSMYVMDDDLQYDIEFWKRDNHYDRGNIEGVLEKDVERGSVEAIFDRYARRDDLDGWNEDFNSSEDKKLYDELFGESYAINRDELGEVLEDADGNIRNAKYVNQDCSDLDGKEIKSIIFDESIIPERIEVSEYNSQDDTLYDVRVWGYDSNQDSADLRITVSGSENLLNPAEEGTLRRTLKEK